MKDTTIDSIIDSLITIPKTDPSMMAQCEMDILTFQAANQMSLSGLAVFCKKNSNWVKEEILHI